MLRISLASGINSLFFNDDKAANIIKKFPNNFIFDDGKNLQQDWNNIGKDIYRALKLYGEQNEKK